MNGNDLLDALSGIDHKYIDEAAYELHDMPVRKKQGKVIRMNRTALIAIPAAAVILLTVSVALPSLLRTKNESASYSASDSAATESAAPAYDAAEEPAYDAAEAPAYEPEYEAADMAAETAVAAAKLGLDTAVYENGILTVEITGDTPDRIEDMDYIITEVSGGTVCSDGKLREILWGINPLMLDLSKLDLSAGTYTLSIGDESIDFICP